MQLSDVGLEHASRCSVTRFTVMNGCFVWRCVDNVIVALTDSSAAADDADDAGDVCSER